MDIGSARRQALSAPAPALAPAPAPALAPVGTAPMGAAPVGTSVLDWSWPPYAPLEPTAARFDTPEWAPASTVWHPQLRVGRWTVLYRRSA